MPSRMALMVTTTSNSISVNPDCRFMPPSVTSNPCRRPRQS